MSTLKELLKDVPVEWKALIDLVEILDSKRKPISKSQRISGIYPYYGANGVQDYVNDYIFDGTYLLIGEDGSVINEDGSPVINWAIGKIWVNNHAHILAEKSNSSLRYLYYFLSTIDVRKIVKGSIPKITQQDLRKIQIPIPYPNNPEKSLAVQQEIVRVLDGLSEHNKSLTTALAQQIAQRKKQYAFYREELFRFEGKEVEWKTFGDLGEIIRGNGLQKSDFMESGVGCIHYGQIYTYYGTSTDKTKSYVSHELAKKLKKVYQGDLIITNTSENIEDVCKAVAWLGADEIVTGGHACILKHRENPKYIAYYTQCAEFFKDKKKFAKGTKVMDVSAKDLAKIKIPIPSIQEQERIVRLLDQFDEATKNIVAQLEKEIALRNKQYEYYRNQLLGFSR